jgi:hypothetical protein
MPRVHGSAAHAGCKTHISLKTDSLKSHPGRGIVSLPVKYASGFEYDFDMEDYGSASFIPSVENASSENFTVPETSCIQDLGLDAIIQTLPPTSVLFSKDVEKRVRIFTPRKRRRKQVALKWLHLFI